MTGLPRFDFYPRDWHLDTRDLSQAAKGVYIDFLSAMYARGGPLPYTEADLCRLCGCRTVRSLRPLLAELIKKGKLRVTDGCLVNNRAMEEIDKAHTAHGYRSKGGKARSSRVRAEYEPNTTGTPLETEGETVENQGDDQCSPSPSPSPTRVNKKEYRFSGKVIRLTGADYDTWQARYHTLPDLAAELAGLDDWYADKCAAREADTGKWWHAIQGALNKKHQRLVAERRQEGAATDILAETDRLYRDLRVDAS